MDSKVHIGIIGDYEETRPSHIATNEAIRHCSKYLCIETEVSWLPTEILEGIIDLSAFDAFWCAPGSPYKSFAGAINAIRFVRENDYPFIGTCGGFQHAVLEYAINVLGIQGAGHQEIDPGAPAMVVTALACSLAGQARNISLKARSLVREIYGSDTIEERYNCSFGLSPEFRDMFEQSGFAASGTDENGDVRILEIPQKHFFLATLFQPQLISSADKPHRLISRFLIETKRSHDTRKRT